MKRLGKWLTTLLAIMLLVAGILPNLGSEAKADWKDDLWSVYSQITGEDEESDEAKSSDDRSEYDDSYQDDESFTEATRLDEDGTYTSKDDVAAYIHEYDKLPENFITKKEAKKLGWDSKAGNLDKVAPGKSIGGDYFGNYEGQLPEKKKRDYYECDIDYKGGRRGAKRIIFSNDGLIYYTEDHYETFELLYGEE